MNFIESPTTWAVIVSQYLLSGFNKATCRVIRPITEADKIKPEQILF